MVRPECYQCAVCGEPWSSFFPRTVCKCGADVLRRVAAKLAERLEERRERLGRIELDDLVSWVDAGWSPYAPGNGDEGDNTW